MAQIKYNNIKMTDLISFDDCDVEIVQNNLNQDNKFILYKSIEELNLYYTNQLKN
jgi:hypothetical protein